MVVDHPENEKHRHLRHIEELIDNQLAPLVALMPEEEKNARKESLLKQFATGRQQQQFLNQHLVAH